MLGGSPSLYYFFQICTRAGHPHSLIPVWTLVQCSHPPLLAILPRAHTGVCVLSLSHPATASPVAFQGVLPYSSPQSGFQHLAYQIQGSGVGTPLGHLTPTFLYRASGFWASSQSPGGHLHLPA